MLVRRSALWTAAVAAALVLAACGAPDLGPTAGEESGPSADLIFTVATVDGDPFDGASLAGRPAVLWFWAPWCVTCVAEARHVAALVEDYAGQASVVGVAGLDDDVESMRWFIDATGVDGFPHLADSDGVVWQRFGITAQSSFVVLDADGAVMLQGVLTPTDVRERLDALVA